ncbi:hypothetical protein Ahy_A03g012000 [Arachis hypogaea]|uniref:DUF223 domain-containing protein n=1 Tax=Arachis hypogaea TaxID=3818 RepID=A0A445DSE8_ARAHY|nr:hypothetical protein Ahy_A03g012000 [Arachis hypogaea]
MWSLCDPREEIDELAFLHIVVMDKSFSEASYSLETVESVLQIGQDSIYLIDVMDFLISVRDYSDVELDDEKIVFKWMRLALMNAVSQPPIILFQSVKVKIYEGKVVVQNVIDCSKIMINPDIPEAVCFITRLDPLESYFIDSIILGNGFIVADVDDDFVNLSINRSIKELRENDAPHDEISSLGSRISVTSDNMKSIEVNMEALGAAYNLTKLNEEFYLDASDFLYKLIGKKLVFMVDHQPVESDTICPAYNVFKVSTHEFILKLIESVENRVLNAHKYVHVVNEIICNKRLASPYRDVPRSTNCFVVA